ncbi:SDR family oxidoreductase [Rhodoferax lacus]|nr:NAD(P)-dependent oxidoreductase [Rhodoferax lacus]
MQMMIQNTCNTVAIVGASSQIGEALLPKLLTAGYVTYCIGRKSKTGDFGITYVFDQSIGRFEPNLISVDTVISLAPLPSIGSVLKMAKTLGAKRIIAFGSTGRFSKVGSTSIIERDFVSQQEAAENFFSMQCEASSIAWTLLRPTMIYGANADQNVSFVDNMVQRFGIFPMPIGASGLRQPVHVEDLAMACILVLQNKITENKAYNLGGGQVLSFPNLVRKVFRDQGKMPILIPTPLLLYSLLIKLAQYYPPASFVRMEMVCRMFQDLIADNKPAFDDFGYSPRAFAGVSPQQYDDSKLNFH